jgi:signal transduction histidine kinase
MGLAMAFRVVQLHGGTIDFSSEIGQGTMFRLRFPALTAHEAGRAVERAHV